MKHIVCHSGGESSALVGVEVARKFGPENVVLVNHDLHFTVEDTDIKRFKNEVADHIGVPITFANYKDQPAVLADQFDVCVKASAFKIKDGSELCTSRLKTEPFRKFLERHFADKDCTVYYGFDANEQKRITRRVGIMGSMGYRTDYPLALWPDRTINALEEVGIAKPGTYSVFKHGNCVGCLKAGWQHWYIVYCTRPDIWLKAKWAEEEIGYAIHHDDTGPVYLSDMEPRFADMLAAGVPATEQVPHQTFWAKARKVVKIHQEQTRAMPCECSF